MPLQFQLIIHTTKESNQSSGNLYNVVNNEARCETEFCYTDRFLDVCSR